MLRVHGIAAELFDCLPVEHICKVLVIPYVDLLDFMRCAEPVEEVHYRHAALNCCKVSNCAKIHAFLRAV